MSKCRNFTQNLMRNNLSNEFHLILKFKLKILMKNLKSKNPVHIWVMLIKMKMNQSHQIKVDEERIQENLIDIVKWVEWLNFRSIIPMIEKDGIQKEDLAISTKFSLNKLLMLISTVDDYSWKLIGNMDRTLKIEKDLISIKFTQTIQTQKDVILMKLINSSRMISIKRFKCLITFKNKRQRTLGLKLRSTQLKIHLNQIDYFKWSCKRNTVLTK